MELAVPLIALGGLYVASNQEKKKEGYENMGKPVNSLPNYNEPPVNYPTLKGVKNTNPNKYRDSNTVTDRFFKPSVYQEFKNGPDQLQFLELQLYIFIVHISYYMQWFQRYQIV